MRLSYPIAAPDSSVKLQAFCGEYEPAFEWLAGHGYTGVELLVRDPAALDVGRLDGLLTAWGLEISAIGTSPMQVQDHIFLLCEDEENRREAMARCRDLIGLAAYYKVPALIGKYRGQVVERPGCRMEDLARVFKEICGEAKKKGVRVLVEPQNAGNLNNLNTMAETMEWIDETGIENLGIQADIFHMGITERSITESLKAAGDRIGFIHMADSGRMVPGLGELPIRQVLRTLGEISYGGYLSMEIRQWPDSRRAAALSALALNYLDNWE